MFWRNHHVSRAEQSIGPRGEDADFFGRTINWKIYLRPIAAANPVPLHFLERIAPVNRVEVGQQFLGVGGDAEHPLAHRLLGEWGNTALALSRHEFLLCPPRA